MAATVTAKELRYQAGRILRKVMAGERVTVTWRGRPVAVLTPVEMEDRFEPMAFGLWRGREDLEDVEQWLAKLRQPRSLP